MRKQTAVTLAKKYASFIKPQEAAKLQGATLIDVRDPFEYETRHIKGSQNIPCNTVSEETVKHLNKSVPLVVFCRSGGRAKRATETFEKLGFTNVTCVQDGGMENIGLDTVVSGSQVWSMDRQVRFTAGSLVLTGAAVIAVGHPVMGTLLAAGIGGGLVFSAVTDTCAMAQVLSKMPWNQVKKQ